MNSDELSSTGARHANPDLTLSKGNQSPHPTGSKESLMAIIRSHSG